MNSHVYDKWSFPEDGMRRQLIVKSRMLCDDADVARRWALEGWASSTNRGLISARMFRRAGWKCSCRSTQAKRRPSI
jgi:hypothetical protein